MAQSKKEYITVKMYLDLPDKEKSNYAPFWEHYKTRKERVYHTCNSVTQDGKGRESICMQRHYSHTKEVKEPVGEPDAYERRQFYGYQDGEWSTATSSSAMQRVYYDEATSAPITSENIAAQEVLTGRRYGTRGFIQEFTPNGSVDFYGTDTVTIPSIEVTPPNPFGRGLSLLEDDQE